MCDGRKVSYCAATYNEKLAYIHGFTDTDTSIVKPRASSCSRVEEPDASPHLGWPCMNEKRSEGNDGEDQHV